MTSEPLPSAARRPFAGRLAWHRANRSRLARLRLPALSIRVRLALWFTVIVTVVLVALSAAVIRLTSDGLLSELRRDVHQRTNELVATVAPGLLDGSGESRVLNVFSQLDVYCQVVYPDGTLAASGSNLDGLRLPFAASATELQREQVVERIPLILDQQPVLRNGSVAGYVIVGRSPASIYAALGRLRSILYPAAAVALLLGGLAGWLLVRRAIRPLERVGAVAAAITASHDHGLRVGYRGPADEIGRLAATIDGMLASLDEAHGELAAANASQRQFLLDVSHELRTPLTIMLSSLDILARTGADQPGVAKTLAPLRSEVDRMRRMVTQLLIMARSQAGAPMSRAPLLLADLLADACGQVHVDGVRLTLDEASLRRIEDVVVEGDQDYLKQLLLILLDNAVKYTPPGGAVVVTCGTTADEAWVEVRDTGIGIPPDELERVFERFYRGSNAAASEGSGLGLAIARHIAALHGGAVRAASIAGVGSTFTVTLPVLATEADTD